MTLIQTSRVYAWGWRTHQFIENEAEDVFSDNSFFFNRHSTIYEWCIKPDQGWGGSDWHWLDAISYHPLVTTGGQLPWAVENVFDNIVRNLRDENWEKAAQLMGAICHYTGDSTNPLHSTWDYTPGGNHGSYESQVNGRLGEISIPDYVPQELDNIFDATMATLEESFDFTDEDPNGGVNLSDFLENDILWNDTIKSITENRLRAGVQFTANIWYTAMIRAGLVIQAPTLSMPGNGAIISDNTPTFEWSSTVAGYQLEYAPDNAFTTNVAIVKDLTTTSYTPVTPLADGTWFWHVRSGDNTTSVGLWSDTWQFTIAETIAIIGAMYIEVNPIKSEMEVTNQFSEGDATYWEGTLYGEEVVLVQSGVGLDNANSCITYLVNNYDLKEVIFSGVAGACNPDLKIMDVVISSVVTFDYDPLTHQMNFSWEADPTLISLAETAGDSVSLLPCENNPNPQIVTGNDYTVENITEEFLYKDNMWNYCQVQCFEMEDSAIADVCTSNNVPFVCVRCISDYSTPESLIIDYPKYKDNAAKNAAMVVLEMIDELHDPIYIEGNDNFTPANGVNGGGSGTENDPYIIENWDISAESAHGIEIRNTTAYFIIRKSLVENGRWGGYCGIYLENVANGKVENCIVENNYFGIRLYYSSNNAISNNLVENNLNGIRLEGSSNNLLYHNNLVNNGTQAYDDGTNRWDAGYPSGGNYWSDYTGPDNYSGENQNQPGSDGIGDTPYPIPGDNNQDRYPLMNPWPVPHLGTAVFSVVDLYTVNVEKILYLNQGSKLVVKFYTYGDAFENENVIENFVPPWLVEENESARHPEGIGVKKARLDLTADNTENVISTIATFTTTRSYLIGRISAIKSKWPFALIPERSILIKEISDIKAIWPFA